MDIKFFQECYGILCIPEGLWFCAKCEARDKEIVSRIMASFLIILIKTCALCPNTFGAFKKTTDNRWAHVVCVAWMPEKPFRFSENGMKTEIDLDKISKSRFSLTCEVCKSLEGACLTCTEKGCNATFHASCGFVRGFLESHEEVKKRITCFKHTPKKKRKVYKEPKKTETRRRRQKKDAKKRKFLEIFSHETITLNQAEKALGKRAPYDSVPALWDFWVNKRKARSGNPLLKRLMVCLHLFIINNLLPRNLFYSVHGPLFKRNLVMRWQ